MTLNFSDISSNKPLNIFCEKGFVCFFCLHTLHVTRKGSEVSFIWFVDHKITFKDGNDDKFSKSFFLRFIFEDEKEIIELLAELHLIGS